jgi:hypothetical protein
VGPTAIFDKSALQALSMDESVWFDAFFSVNVTPIFFVETLADLEKEVAAGRSAEDLVGMLAEKTPSSAYPNVHHRTLLAAELDGHEIAMDGKPLISAGETRRTEDGKIGIHIDELPEQAGLLRWQEHDFLEIERELARDWRANLSGHDPDRLVGLVKNVLPDEVKFSDLGQLKRFVDKLCSHSDPHVMALALQVVEPPEAQVRRGLVRWQQARRPPLDRFFPYLAHVFKVDLLFYLGIHRGFISGERPSNRVDIAYLYYLPFGAAFTSGDRLHRMTVPLFLDENQTYLEAKELKSALAELDGHYDELPDAVKETGVLAFVSFPPSGIENAVTRLWDRHMRPDWREVARAREARLGEPQDVGAKRETLDELKERLANSEEVAEEQVDASGPDYFVTSRRVRAKKGKWRMVSQEIQDAGQEDDPR